MKRNLFTLAGALIVLLVLAGCENSITTKRSNTQVESVSVEYKHNILLVNFDASTAVYRIIVPYDARNVSLHIETVDKSAQIIYPAEDGTAALALGSNSFVFWVIAEDGTSAQYLLEIIRMKFDPPWDSGLPVIMITTPGSQPITDRENWIEGASYTLYGFGADQISGVMDIKGRGNSTWGMPKKPYSLKLSTKTSVLGMPEHKRWALLANYADKTLLRTELAFKTGNIFDNLGWTPRSEQVMVYLNNDFLGVYQLTETVKVDENRVNIETISKKKKPGGGYLLEIDVRQGEKFNFTTTKGVVFCCSDPDDGLDTAFDPATGLNGSLFDKIQNDVQHVEDVLYSDNFRDPGDGYQKYIDAGSFVDWYLVNELTKNNDAVFFTSVYMYYDPDKKKYCMGPLWDFDISLGNIDYNNNDRPEGFWIKESPWISRLFEDPYFVSLVKARWNMKKADLDALGLFIDERAGALRRTQEYNFVIWPILDQYVWPNAVVTGSYQGEIDYLKSWLNRRISWLHTAINSLSP